MLFGEQQADPVGDWCFSMGKRAFRSPIVCLVACSVLGFGIMFFGWNLAVDCFILAKGKRTQVQVIDEKRSYSGNSTYNTTAIFEYHGAGQPDNYHLFSKLLNMNECPSGCESAMLQSGTRKCGRYGQLTVSYLPEAPGVFVVHQDIGRLIISPVLIVLGLLGLIPVGFAFARSQSRNM